MGLSLKHRHSFRTRYPQPALEGGWIEPTIPNKTNSRLQRYRLTAAGRGKPCITPGAEPMPPGLRPDGLTLVLTTGKVMTGA